MGNLFFTEALSAIEKASVGGKTPADPSGWEAFVSFLKTSCQEIGAWFWNKDASGRNRITRLVLAITVLVLCHYLIKLIIRLIKAATGAKNKRGIDVSVRSFTVSLVNVALNLILAFIVLRILKIDVSSLAQILSAGTVAIGLSLQNIISACASGIILLKSKHFRTGDYIQVQGDATAEGTVTSVGVMATALDTVNGQHVVIPNDQLRKGVITNYSRNPVRRRVVDIGVDYETDTEKCKKVLLDILAKDERVLKDPKPSVYLTDLAEYYINFSVRAYIENKDYWDVYLQFREKVLLAFREQNIQIPFRRFVLERNLIGDKRRIRKQNQATKKSRFLSEIKKDEATVSPFLLLEGCQLFESFFRKKLLQLFLFLEVPWFPFLAESQKNSFFFVGRVFVILQSISDACLF